MKTTLMTVLAVLLCLGLYLYARFGEGPPTPPGEATVSIVPRGEVAGFEISDSTTGKKVTVRKENGEWKGTRDNINSFLDFWTAPQLRSLGPVPSSDLRQFGLNPPQKTIRIWTEKGSEKIILVGDKAPVGWDLYLKLSDSDSLYQVPDFRISEFPPDEATFSAPPPK